ncbi:MAG: hypothetical protein HYZ53_22105 [Planctomycetes bacterium]|nr:hypothetical protein [Planctomycetota bacterium]
MSASGDDDPKNRLPAKSRLQLVAEEVQAAVIRALQDNDVEGWERREAEREKRILATIRQLQQEGKLFGGATGAESKGPDELAAAVVLEPRADAPREAFAAAVAATDPPRAELVLAQLEVARRRRAGERYDALAPLLARAMALCAAHGRRWAAAIDPLLTPAPPYAPRFQFRRGFVEEVRTSSGAFLASADRLFGAAPILDLVITSLDGAAAEFFACRWLAKLRSLSFFNAGLTDRDAEALATSPVLGRLAWLDLRSNRLTDRGIDAIGATECLAGLRWCGLAHNRGKDPNPLGDEDESGRRGVRRTEAGVRLVRQFGPLPWLGRFTSADPPDPEALA